MRLKFIHTVFIVFVLVKIANGENQISEQNTNCSVNEDLSNFRNSSVSMQSEVHKIRTEILNYDYQRGLAPMLKETENLKNDIADASENFLNLSLEKNCHRISSVRVRYLKLTKDWEDFKLTPKNVMQFNETISILLRTVNKFGNTFQEITSQNSTAEFSNVNNELLSRLTGYLEQFKKLDPQFASQLLEYLMKNGSIIVPGLTVRRMGKNLRFEESDTYVKLQEKYRDAVYYKNSVPNNFLTDNELAFLRKRGYTGNRYIKLELYLELLEERIYELSGQGPSNTQKFISGESFTQFDKDMERLKYQIESFPYGENRGIKILKIDFEMLEAFIGELKDQESVDPEEISRVSDTVKDCRLSYAVLTSKLHNCLRGCIDVDGEFCALSEFGISVPYREKCHDCLEACILDSD